jgi:hypothetical protein
MGAWTEHDPRNVTYPAAPEKSAERKAFMDKRNERIGSHGAARAMETSGKSIGEAKTAKKET